jgi:hypothetical protein
MLDADSTAFDMLPISLPVPVVSPMIQGLASLHIISDIQNKIMHQAEEHLRTQLKWVIVCGEDETIRDFCRNLWKTSQFFHSGGG